MENKKEPGRYTLRFNVGDPVHRKAMAYLMEQNPRSKANYIANAILHYESAMESQSADDGSKITQQEIEDIIRNVLSKDKSAQAESVPRRDDVATQNAGQAGQLGEKERALINKSLVAFSSH